MNALIHETSPYLLQHAHNPVQWFPWKKEILEKAKQENQLILVSIGYAACHWCHVMEKECFEDPQVAQLMNELFVNIKVDREERPDVDHFYMDAIQLMNGNGGWPLNCICLPDGTPIFGATYVPKNRWLDTLQKVHDYVHKNHEKALEVGKNVLKGIQNFESTQNLKRQSEISEKHIHQILDNLLKKIDFEEGGFKTAPKFPTPINWIFLTRLSTKIQNPQLDTAILTTLKKMALGGIYDQVGGGFARYSVDEYWKVPHFEKMLYDNAQLIQLYTEAYQKFKNPLFKSIVYETVNFLFKELLSPENAFSSSLDADSEGIEGKFYIWTYSELKEILQEDFPLFAEIFNIQQLGNWEHGYNILFLSNTLEEIANKKNIPLQNLIEKVHQWKKTLYNLRNQRIRPITDDKILLSWNALTIQSLAYASRVFDEPQWLEKSLLTFQFIENQMKKNEEFYFRTHKNGKSKIDAFLEDYVTIAHAALELFVSTGDAQYLKKVFQITQTVQTYFYDDKSQVFQFANKEFNELLVNKTELYDSVIPSSNSMMMNLLMTLYHIEYEPQYFQMIENILLQLLPLITQYPNSHANWAWLLSRWVYGENEWVITGKENEKFIQKIEQEFYKPFLLKFPLNQSLSYMLFRGKYQEETNFYLCEKGSCQKPETQLDNILHKI